ncbi:MAG TPA: glycosyltransferase family 39 protein [Nitrososphaera sp.]|nr:glycosyltransferase family 39 protein [Nitrososphaera sp.]
MLVVLIPLALSAYTHLWNPVGFPNLFYDEGVYMRRAMHVMEGLGPQEAYYYDHPFFGQIFLGSMLTIVGYAESLNTSPDVDSIASLYEVPRILMGILAVIDTFLIYQISQRMYNKNVALIGSVLFAVMPIAWFTRMILLDSILLPFLLLSILLAVHTTRAKSEKDKNSINNIWIVLSGVFLGTAIFTKIPAFTMIPLVALLIYRNNGKSLKALGIWLAPVILIPLLWPAQSVVAGAFSSWTNDVLWQINRENAGLPWIVFLLAITDPFIFITGISGLVYSVIRRDYFNLLWTLPFIAFLGLMGYTNFFYWIPILPALCIGSAKLIFDMMGKIPKISQKALSVVILSTIAVFGLTSTSLLIVTNVTSAQLESIAFVIKYLEVNAADSTENVTLISNPVYSWIFKYVFDNDHILSDYRDIFYSPIDTDKSRIILMDDPRFKLDIGNENNQLLQELHRNTSTIETFKGKVTNFDLGLYPYTSMIENYEGSEVAVRVNNSHS